MSEAKYHHRIPKIYLKSWCISGDTVWYYDKEKGISERRNIGSILGEKYYHSIRAGAIFTTSDSLNKIFTPLNQYMVFYKDKNGYIKELKTNDERNKKFYDYNNWIIKSKNGIDIPGKEKKYIYEQILQIKDNSIENAWSQKYENSWKNTISEIESTIIDIHDRKEITLTYEAYKTIIDYFIMFQWRSSYGYNIVRETFDCIMDIIEASIGSDIDIGKMRDELWHNYQLSQYYKFLFDNGLMNKEVDQYYSKLTPLFLIDKSKSIITSDNPSFMFTNKEGYTEPILVALPGLIISLAKKNPVAPNEYKIKELNKEEVKYYNQVIFENASKLISRKELSFV